MARSSYVYVVVAGDRPGGLGLGPPLAAFTVKHELVTWLERLIVPETMYRVWRLPDNPLGYTGERHPAVAELNIADLLGVTGSR